MTTAFTGSNYGVISTLNSGSGTLTLSQTTTFSYENVQNYSAGSIFLTISGGGLGTLTIYYSTDSSGTNTILETTKSIMSSQIINFFPKGKFLKIVLTNNSGTLIYTIQTRFDNSYTPNPINGVLSSNNSIVSGTVTANSTISGSYENVLEYSLISININASCTITPATASLDCYFSTDGINTDRIISYPIQDCTANSTTSSTSLTFNPAHTLVPISKYFKIVFTNTTAANLTNVNLSIFYHLNTSKPLTSRVTQYLTDYFDSDTTRTVINGRTEGTLLPGGNYQNIQTTNGSLNVCIRSPNSAFGEVLNASLTPFVQFDFTCGRPLNEILIYQNDTSNSSYNFIDSKAQINASNSLSTAKKIELKSNQFTKYKAGQGCDNRFTAKFSSGYLDYCDQYAGIFTPEDSLTFGYFKDASNSEFAIRYQSFGAQQMNRITIVGNATSSTTVVYNFGGTTVNINAVSGDTPLILAQKTYSAIQSNSLATYGFNSEYYYTDTSGSTVYYLDIIYNISSSSVVSMSVSGVPTGSTITVSTLRSGLNPTTTIIPQSSWNIDTCKDMGSLQQNYIRNQSGFRLDPTKGNVFKIAFQYLGFGAITFYIEQNETEAIIPVHRIKYPNTNTKPSMRDPSLRIGIGIDTYNGFLNGTSATIETASCASFLQGVFKPSPIYRSYGYTIVGNDITGGSLTRKNPAILFGLKGINNFQSTNSNSSNVYTVNNTNIYFSTLCLSVNTASNTNTNLIVMLIKNPTTIAVRPTPTNYVPIQKYNNNLVNVINGVTVTATAGYILTGGDIVLEYNLYENSNLVLNISDLNILMTESDSYYFAFYGSSSAVADVSGSLSYNINM